MAIRIAARLALLLASLALATVLVVGALAALASRTPAQATSLRERGHAAAVERETQAPVEDEAASGAASTPAIALVFAGIVLLAALPPAHRVHVYHRSSYRFD